MNTFPEIVTTILATLTLGGFGLVIVYLASFVFYKRKWARQFHQGTARFIPLLGFVVTTSAALSTLLFSELIGFEPCELCWYQRIMLYPQVVLFGLMLLQQKKHVDLLPIISFSAIGGVIASIHIYVQFSQSAIICDVTRVTCDTVYFLKFGFISMPVMSLALFALLLLSGLAARSVKSDPQHIS